MTTTFENAKVGDKVWCVRNGWGYIHRFDDGGVYPLVVRFDNSRMDRYTKDGKYMETDSFASLFWDEVTIIAPPKPLPKLAVDTKVLVWNTHGDTTSKTKRYFSHFSSSGNPCCFFSGRSSFTKESDADWIEWDKYELAEGGEA